MDLISLAHRLREDLSTLSEPKDCDVYNPLDYAWYLHERYLIKYILCEGSIGGHAYEGKTLVDELSRRLGDTHVAVKQIVYMTHPSPSNPAANAGWIGLARQALVKGGIL